MERHRWKEKIRAKGRLAARVNTFEAIYAMEGVSPGCNMGKEAAYSRDSETFQAKVREVERETYLYVCALQ